MTASNLQERVRFVRIRYANCWEDAAVLTAALQPASGKRILSIASGGDNAFALLAGGAEVVAADLSAAQLACVELKAATIRQFDRDETLAFFGIRESLSRPAHYAQLRGELSLAARTFWDEQPAAIDGGFIHAGKFEHYFHLFRRRVLPLVHSRRTIEALLKAKSEPEREEFYWRRWDTWRWRLMFRVFFSRWVMGRLGRDPEFFRYVEGSVADRILSRTQYALTVLPTHENPWLHYILTGNFTQALPPYLEPDMFARVRDGLNRLTLHLGPIEEAAEQHRGAGFDGFNLSDIFEYLDAESSAGLYERLLAAARPGARLAYWNMLVPRACPTSCAARVQPLTAQAAELWACDRAFFYRGFVLEEVR
jgi:S-adenosylmethionine-diacylglycerol 3-amino-3-carboxypropyl transferase